MSAPKLSPACHDVIAEMAEAGARYAQIAHALKRRFGVSVSDSAISWHVLRLGAEPDARTQVREVPDRPCVIRRGDHLVRRFTKAEDAALLALEAEGLSDTEIGKRLGRRCNTIRGRLMTLARHEARRERAGDAP
jgi:transposase